MIAIIFTGPTHTEGAGIILGVYAKGWESWGPTYNSASHSHLAILFKSSLGFDRRVNDYTSITQDLTHTDN